MISLYINDKLADVEYNFFDKLSISAEYDDIDSYGGSGQGDSLIGGISSIKLPATTNNLWIFDVIGNHATNSVNEIKHRVSIKSNGIEIFNGSCYVVSTDFEYDQHDGISIKIVSTNSELWSRLDKVNVTDIDYGLVEVYDDNTIKGFFSKVDEQDQPLITTSYDRFLFRDYIIAPALYGYAQYGEVFYGDKEPTGLSYAWSDLKPHLYLKETLEKIVRSVGYNIQSEFFDTDYFRGLVIMNTNGDNRARTNDIRCEARLGDSSNRWLPDQYNANRLPPSIDYGYMPLNDYTKRTYAQWRRPDSWGVSFDDRSFYSTGPVGQQITHDVVVNQRAIYVPGAVPGSFLSVNANERISEFTVPVDGVYEVECNVIRMCDNPNGTIYYFGGNMDTATEGERTSVVGFQVATLIEVVSTIGSEENTEVRRVNRFNMEPYTTVLDIEDESSIWYLDYESKRVSNVHFTDFGYYEQITSLIPFNFESLNKSRKVYVNMKAGWKLRVTGIFCPTTSKVNTKPYNITPTNANIFTDFNYNDCKLDIDKTNIRIKLTDKIMYGGNIDLSTCLPKVAVKDLIKAVNQMFGLVWKVDSRLNSVSVEPRFDYVLENFKGDSLGFQPERIYGKGFYSSFNNVDDRFNSLTEISNTDSIINFKNLYGSEAVMSYKYVDNYANNYVTNASNRIKDNAINWVKINLNSRIDKKSILSNSLFTDIVPVYTPVNGNYLSFLPFALPDSYELTSNKVLPKPTFQSNPKIAGSLFNFASIKYADVLKYYTKYNAQYGTEWMVDNWPGTDEDAKTLYSKYHGEYGTHKMYNAPYLYQSDIVREQANKRFDHAIGNFNNCYFERQEIVDGVTKTRKSLYWNYSYCDINKELIINNGFGVFFGGNAIRTPTFIESLFSLRTNAYTSPTSISLFNLVQGQNLTLSNINSTAVVGNFVSFRDINSGYGFDGNVISYDPVTGIMVIEITNVIGYGMVRFFNYGIGIQERRGLWSTFWRDYSSSIKKGAFLTTTMYISEIEYKNIDFRKKYVIPYMGRHIEAILIKVDNFNIDSDGKCTLTFMEIVRNRLEGNKYYLDTEHNQSIYSYVSHVNII